MGYVKWDDASVELGLGLGLGFGCVSHRRDHCLSGATGVFFFPSWDRAVPEEEAGNIDSSNN